jgi:hypothetical protein
MMDLNEIRNGFSKFGISANKAGISLIIPQYNPAQWITVSVDDEEMKNRTVFLSLLHNCKAMRVFLLPNQAIRIEFVIDTGLENELVFPPLEREITRAEIEELIRSSDRAPNENYVQAFQDADYDDDESVLECLLKFTELEMQDEVFSLDSLRKFPIMREIAHGFYQKCIFGELDIEEADEWNGSGGIIFSMESDSPRVFEIPENAMREFQKLMDIATWFTIDGFVDTGFSSFVLSVFS